MTTSVRRRAKLAPAVLLLALVAAGCGGSSDPAPAEPAPSSTSQSTGPQRIEIAFDGDQVTPNGERVEVARGVEFEFVVTADAPGELHLHSTPEQELAFDAGTTTLPVTIDRPGVVEVESHDLDLVIVQLEVR